MKVIINGIEKDIINGTKILDLIEDDKYKYQAARVNNRIRELNYELNDDSNVELLTLSDSNASTIYQSTLRYLIVMAVERVFPKAKVLFNYSISRTIFANVSNIDRPFFQDDLDLIQDELVKIINSDLPITRSTVLKEEALKYYEEIGYYDKVEILKYRPENLVHMYECDGYKNYMFGYMLPSTGFIREYRLKLYSPGFVIQYPRSEEKGEIPPFKDEKVYKNVLKQANIWGKITSSGYISDLNKIVDSGKALEFINICETRHNNQLAALGNKILNNMETIKLIAVAGPSSSGKTTFTNRLRITLKSLGIDPFMISIDDFYQPGPNKIVDEMGKPDFEHIDALDRKLFNEIMYKLIKGEEVRLPHYDFKTRSRSFSNPIKLKDRQPILIEGIHALNDDLTPSIPNEMKFKVYIAPQPQLHIDDHNPISISDIRLIRRMVRDYETRNTNCEQTLGMWSSVRRGEFRWIYPHQADADFVYNSELTYELCVMKKHALPLLEKVPVDSPYYIQANRLIKFLKYFKDISDKWIPCNSIVREFIGGSIFYTEDLI